MTKDKVYIGVGTTEDVGQWADAAGLKGISAGDTKAQIAALVKDIERRGGLEGRKIEIVWHDYKTAQLLADPATANQAACEDWTRDHQVFAVFALYDRTLASCLRKTNTPLIYAGAGWDLTSMRIYQGVFKRFPNFYLLGAMLGDRFDRMSIERLVARDFFQKWDTRAGRPGAEPMKLGLLFPDVPEGYTSRKSVVKELARHGIKPASVIMYNNEGLGVQGQQNAVLRFRSDGITHVIGARRPFMNAADPQGYYPRYFIGYAINIYAQNAPADQLRGSMAVSILPALDVGRDQDPGDPTSATTYCKKVMKAAGQSTSDRTTLWAMEALCDQFFFVKDAVDKAGELTTAGLQRGLEALGNRPSALTWTSYLGPGNHASARSMRDLAYKTDCRCFVYTSTKTHTDQPR